MTFICNKGFKTLSQFFFRHSLHHRHEILNVLVRLNIGNLISKGVNVFKLVSVPHVVLHPDGQVLVWLNFVTAIEATPGKVPLLLLVVALHMVVEDVKV